MACSRAFFLKVCGYVRYCPVLGEVPQLYSSSGGLIRPSAKEAWLLRRAHTRKLFKANWCQYAVYFQEMLPQWEYQEAGVLGTPFQIMNFSAGRNPRSHPVQYCHSTNEEPMVQRHSKIHRSLGSLAAELGTKNSSLQIPIQFYSEYMLSASSSLNLHVCSSAQILNLGFFLSCHPWKLLILFAPDKYGLLLDHLNSFPLSFPPFLWALPSSPQPWEEK